MNTPAGRDDGPGRLARAARAVVDPRRPLLDCIAEVRSMVESVRAVATFAGDLQHFIGQGETRVASGMAISPTQAAMCADDVLRTGAFVRGLHAAVTDASHRIRQRPVRVLYAGCGPYALLAVPLMTLLEPEQVTFRLIDLHRPSIDSARSVVNSLGLDRQVSGYELTDACRYRVAVDEAPDVIVSETMKARLEGEPQVAIFRHLLGQAPAAVLVPQSVRVDLVWVHRSREFSLVESTHAGPLPEPRRDRVMLGTAFQLSADAIAGWNPDDQTRLPGARIRVPTPPAPHYTPMLFTRIGVYGDVILQDYDCGLTVPSSLGGGQALAEGDTLAFHYRLGDHPRLVWERLRDPAA